MLQPHSRAFDMEVFAEATTYTVLIVQRVLFSVPTTGAERYSLQTMELRK